MPYIDRFFEILVQAGASDLHLSEGQPPKIRHNGDIKPIREEILTNGEISSLMSEICGPERWDLFLESGDLDFAHEMDAASRFRCNYFKHVHGLGCVFHRIPTKIMMIEDLGLPQVIKSFGLFRGGMVLVTGPTGSGKSTTLAALIDYINTNFTKHIITVEEPIEFVHPNKRSIITQREVPGQAKTFLHGLKAALREDADIILVGEMRDLETIQLALTAAETGLLVFGTLHTNNARKTVDRLVDVFPSAKQSQVRTMLSNSLRAVVAQLLLKRCDAEDRVAVNEILVVDSAGSSIIREGATQKLQDVLVAGKSQGMQFMDDAIAQAMQQGKISPLEAYMKAIDKSRFRVFLGKDAEKYL